MMRILALMALVGTGVITYFTASQFMQAMTLGELRAMIRRQA